MKILSLSHLNFRTIPWCLITISYIFLRYFSYFSYYLWWMIIYVLNRDHFWNYQTISIKNFGLSNWMSGFSILKDWVGCFTTLLVEILSPFLLAYVFSLSFSFILSKKAFLHDDNLKCSTLAWILFWTIRFLTCLFTSTPMDLGLTLKTFPVRPW